jgi:hypothetical protein
MVDIIGGAAALQPKPLQPGPKAKRKVVTGTDGTPHVVYVDLDTGQELQNLSGYNIVEGSNFSDLDSLGLSPTGPEAPKDTAAQQTIQSVKPKAGPIGEGGRSDPTSSNKSLGRSQANNFGYINQPGALGIAGFVPGPVGMAAKAAKVGIGMNNNAAINTARQTMGLPDQSFGSSIKGAVKDQKGHVADVNVNGSMYSVGLEALDKRGMTTMTPDEANKRAAANQTKVQLADDDMIAQKEREFDAEFGKSKGILGKFTSTASSFIDSIFGNEAEETSRAQNTGSNFAPSKGGFADMIGLSGVGKAATSTKTSPVSGAARSTDGKTGGSDKSHASNPGTSGNMGSGAGTTSGHGPGIGSA